MQRWLVVIMMNGPLISLEASAKETIRVQGSISLADRVGRALSESLAARYGDVSLEWDAAGSGAAFNALFAGSAHFGITSRSVQPDEVALARRLGLDLKEVALGLDGIAVVVHPDNDVSSLSIQQLETLYARRIVRWLGVGGIDEEVRLLGLPDASGTHAVFKEIVLGDEASFALEMDYLSTDEILRRVAADRGAIGFLSMSHDRSSVRTVPIVGTEGDAAFVPDESNVARGTYALRHGLWLYTVDEPDGERRHFLTFLFLHDGARLIAEAGLVPVQGLTALRRFTERDPRPVDVFLTRVSFGFRGSRLGGVARRALTDVAQRLGDGDEGVWVAGHSEPAEPTEDRSGAELAEARARAVADFLGELGVEMSRVIVKARGTSEPVARNDLLEGRRSNRRADVWLLPEP